MRPILVELPSKWVAALALLLAAGLFVRDVLRRRKDPKAIRSSNPLLLVVGALVLMGLRADSWFPSSEVLSKDWKPIPIYAYGVMLGSSLIVGWFLAMRLAKEDGIPNEQAASIYMWTAVWSIVGARVLYVITNLDTFDSPLDAFMVHKGGLVAYGGMIGGFFASWYGCRKRKIPLLKWADVSAPSVVLGTGITRIGCLLYGCDYGKRTDLAWALTFPKNSPAWDDHVKTYQLAEDALRSFPVHPTQIYESVVGFALFGLLMYLRKVRRFSGLVFVGWVVGYGIMRPLIEILRDDDQRGAIGPLSTSQFIGVTATLFGVALLVSLLRRHREDPTSLRLWETPLEVEVPARAMPAPAVRRRKKRR